MRCRSISASDAGSIAWCSLHTPLSNRSAHPGRAARPHLVWVSPTVGPSPLGPRKCAPTESTPMEILAPVPGTNLAAELEDENWTWPPWLFSLGSLVRSFRCFPPRRFRHRHEASAFPLPLVLVVFGVGQYCQNENLLAGIQYPRHEPVLISADVKHHAIANDARCRERLLYISPRMPGNALAFHVRIPCPQRPFRLSSTSHHPKQPKSRLRDYPHPFLTLLSALKSIIVRKIRTVHQSSRNTNPQHFPRSLRLTKRWLEPLLSNPSIQPLIPDLFLVFPLVFGHYMYYCTRHLNKRPGLTSVAGSHPAHTPSPAQRSLHFLLPPFRLTIHVAGFARIRSPALTTYDLPLAPILPTLRFRNGGFGLRIVFARILHANLLKPKD